MRTPDIIQDMAQVSAGLFTGGPLRPAAAHRQPAATLRGWRAGAVSAGCYTDVSEYKKLCCPQVEETQMVAVKTLLPAEPLSSPTHVLPI